MNKPVILYLSDIAYFKGGAESSLFDAFDTPGITPILCAPEEGPLTEAAREKGIETCTLDYASVLTVHRPLRLSDAARASGDSLKAAAALKKLAKKYDASAIHSNGLKAQGIACLSRAIGGPPTIAHIRSIPHTPLEKLFWQATQKICTKMVLVSAPCWPGEILPKNAQVIFNGIPDVPSVTPPHEKPFTIGFAGRLHPCKGLHDALPWLKDAKEKGAEFKLLIRGEEDPQAPGYEAELRDQIKELGLEDRCFFEGKKQGYEAIYSGLDAVIVPSTTPDPLPRTCMESAALGLPVLAYPSGGIPYMVRDGKTGFLIKNGDDINDALTVLKDESRYQEIREAAITHAKENFSLDAHHDALGELYRTTLSPAP